MGIEDEGLVETIKPIEQLAKVVSAALAQEISPGILPPEWQGNPIPAAAVCTSLSGNAGSKLRFVMDNRGSDYSRYGRPHARHDGLSAPLDQPNAESVLNPNGFN